MPRTHRQRQTGAVICNAEGKKKEAARQIRSGSEKIRGAPDGRYTGKPPPWILRGGHAPPLSPETRCIAESSSRTLPSRLQLTP